MIWRGDFRGFIGESGGNMLEEGFGGEVKVGGGGGLWG